MPQSIVFQGKKIAFESAGKGPAIVLIHGFLESMVMWNDFRDEISGEFHVICPDLPGHGGSDVFSDVHSMDFMAAAVKAVIDFLKVDHCIIAGHSMGGYVGLAFASLYPEMLKGLVLFHSQAGADDPEARNNRLRTVDLINADKLGFIHQFIPGLFAPDNREKFKSEIGLLRSRAAMTPSQGITAALRGMMMREDHAPSLAKMDFPVAFIVGGSDSRIPAEKVMPQVCSARHSEMLYLRSAGHMGFLEDRDTTLRFLLSFMRRYSSGMIQ